MSWRWVGLSALLGALVITYGLLTRRDNVGLTQLPPPAQPGYYLKDAVIIDTQADGTPLVKLAAHLIEQNPSTESIDLSSVSVDYFGADQRHWLLTAKQGHIPGNSKRIQFQGDVEIRNLSSDNAPRISSERLELDMQQNIAYTDAPVHIGFGPHTLQARGLWADLKAERLQLQSQVNGLFTPQ